MEEGMHSTTGFFAIAPIRSKQLCVSPHPAVLC